MTEITATHEDNLQTQNLCNVVFLAVCVKGCVQIRRYCLMSSVSLFEIVQVFSKLGTIFSVKLNPRIAMHESNDVTDAAKFKILTRGT